MSEWGDDDDRSPRDRKFVIHLPRDTNERSGKRHDVVVRGNTDNLDDDWMDPERFLHVNMLESFDGWLWRTR